MDGVDALRSLDQVASGVACRAWLEVCRCEVLSLVTAAILDARDVVY